MNKRKPVEAIEDSDFEDKDNDEQQDNDLDDVNYSKHESRSRKYMKKRDYDSSLSDDSDNIDYYAKGIINTREKSHQSYDDWSNNYTNTDDMENEDNLNVIVHAVLDELKNSNFSHHKEDKNEDKKFLNFAKQIDDYLEADHTKRNHYLTGHVEFQRKLKKLIKSIVTTDDRDNSLPKFTDTEKTTL